MDFIFIYYYYGWIRSDRTRGRRERQTQDRAVWSRPHVKWEKKTTKENNYTYRCFASSTRPCWSWCKRLRRHTTVPSCSGADSTRSPCRKGAVRSAACTLATTQDMVNVLLDNIISRAICYVQTEDKLIWHRQRPSRQHHFASCKLRTD